MWSGFESDGLVVAVVIDGDDDDVLLEVVSDILLIQSANIDNTSPLLLLRRVLRVSDNTLTDHVHIAMRCGFGIGGLESTGWRCRNGQPVGCGGRHCAVGCCCLPW